MDTTLLMITTALDDTNHTNATAETGGPSPIREDTELLNRIAKGLWSYGSIILLAVGTIGNLLSFLVMMTKQLRGSVTSVYLAVLAVADTMVLYTGLLRQWVRVVFNYDVRLVSNAGCTFHVFLVYSTIWFAIWLLVLVSVERFVNVFYPHSAKRLFSRKTAVLSIFILFASDVILHLFFFWVLEIRKTPNAEICDFYDPDGYLGKQVRKVWPPVNIVLAFWLPSVLVLVFNVSILLKLRCPGRSAVVAPLGNSSGASHTRASSMTLTLLGVAFAFLLAVSPMALYLVLEYRWIDPDEHRRAQLGLWWAVANWLMYCNSSMNFFLYVLAGPRFRRCLGEIFCIQHLKCFQPTGHSLNSNTSQVLPASSVAPQGSANASNIRMATTSIQSISLPHQSSRHSNSNFLTPGTFNGLVNSKPLQKAKVLETKTQ